MDRRSVWLLGRWEIEGGQAALRSHSCTQLIALLALRESSSRSHLGCLIWPESDPVQQSQNLRKALSSIRSSYGEHCILSDGERLRLSPESFWVDVRVLQIARRDQPERLEEALAVYQGALLPDWDYPWVHSERIALEKRFASLAEARLDWLLQEQRFVEARLTGLEVLRHLPMHENIHLAVMRADAGLGRNIDALRQFEELETLLDEEFGERPSERVVQFIQSLPRSMAVVAPLARTGYLPREPDRQLASALQSSTPTILVHGPAQSGKTVLVGKALDRSTAIVTHTDFAGLGSSAWTSIESLYSAICSQVAASMGLESPPNTPEPWLSPNAAFEVRLESLLSQVEGPVIWVMDDVDVAFGYPFSDDFFGLLRSWHNRHALGAKGAWSRLRCVLIYSAEVHLFIRDLNQSPFNVGVTIPVPDFRREEVHKLAIEVGRERWTDHVWEHLGGQPALVRRALEWIGEGVESTVDLHAMSTDLAGPLGGHYRRLIHRIGKDPELRSAIQGLLADRWPEDPLVAARLVAGGLVRRRGDSFAWRVPAYRDVFLEVFGPAVQR